jgi:DNA mismatch repair protein MutS
MTTKTSRKGDKLARVIANMPGATASSNNGKDQSVVEYYLEMLDKHQQELDKTKLTIWMKVGSFFEVYGIKYPDGKTKGNVWDVASDLDIKVAPKDQTVYGNPAIQLYMAGVKEEYAEPYLERLVDRYAWTVAIYDQEKDTSNKCTRFLRQIISPGLNFESDAVSNNFMYIYFKCVGKPSRLSPGARINTLNIAVYFVDCISGSNGVMELFTKDINDYGVVFSELVKIITIKNPSEVVIHLDIPPAIMSTSRQFTEQELFCNLTLFDKCVRYIKNPASAQLSEVARQTLLLEKAYQSHRGRLDIFQQLGIDGQFEYGRLTMCLALDYIFQHDTNIIQRLDKPDVLASSNSYMMLANNCLQQLDIIDPLAKARISQISRDSELMDVSNKLGSSSTMGHRITLLDLLDKTKTVIGRRLFRQRLSIPITNPVELNARYDAIQFWQDIQKTYLAQPGKDSALSPIRNLRSALGNISDIPKYIRKLATGNTSPTDVPVLYQSLLATRELVSVIKKLSLAGAPVNIPGPDKCELLSTIISEMQTTFQLDKMDSHWTQVETNFFKHGYCTEADKLYADIQNNTGFFDTLKVELTRFINPAISASNQLTKDDLLVNEDTNIKLGRYLWLNDKNKLALDARLAINKDHVFTIGDYKIKLDDIALVNIKKGRWHVTTSYIYLSSKNLIAGIDSLRKCLRVEFNKWQTAFFGKYSEPVHEFVEFIGELDVTQSCVFVADAYGYHRPIINKHDAHANSYIQTKAIRHPIVERIRQETKYISNDLEFGVPGQSGILLFGLNSSGKSTTMKSVGCALIMAQAGMFVPAQEFRYWPYQYLFTRIRNNDDIYAGLSSFEVEMKEFKVILKYADVNGLILGDELCSGTETLDATALVASGLQQLHTKGASFLFATHLHFLSELECVTQLENLKFYHLAVTQDPSAPDKLIYDRKLKPGNGPQSYGILVCKSMALDLDFIREAERIRAGIEAGEILTGFAGRLARSSASTSQQTVPTGLGVQALASAPTSHFNREKVFQQCEVCVLSKGTEMHHIGQQADCDCRGILDDGSAHKNSKWNLVCLCKDCHNAVHAKPEPKLEIIGYVPTSRGIELIFNWLKLDDVRPTSPEPRYDFDYFPEGFGVPDEDPDRDDQPQNGLHSLIRELKAEGKTTRAIQMRLRTQFMKRMTLAEIASI